MSAPVDPSLDFQSIRALADKIRALGIGGRQLLGHYLEGSVEESEPARCPAKDLDTGARCVALPQAQHIAPLPAREVRLGKRGVCGCGKPRQEHEGPTHTGGAPDTDCKRYRP